MIPTLFFCSITVLILGLVAAGFNMLRAMDSNRADKNVFFIHAVSGFVYMAGALGSLCFGIAWIVQVFAQK